MSMMKDIFSHASSVIVSLGNAQESSSTVDHLIVDYNSPSYKPILSYSEGDLLGLRQLFTWP